MDVVNLHPTTKVTRGQQRLMTSSFGTGHILVGAVPGQASAGLHVHAVMLTQARWKLPPGGVVMSMEDKLPRFMELDDLEPMHQPLCRDCKGCGTCTFRAGTFTPEEKKSVQFMEDTMAYNEKDQVIEVSYPLYDEADSQPDNLKQVRVVQENIEKRVRKDGLTDKYNKEMQKMIDAGSVRRLTQEERRVWTGGVHYMPHFAVLNRESNSTELRIVMDSASKNLHNRRSFNDLVRPVPNALNDIVDVQLRWRMFDVALNYDLSKAYHSLRTGERELHLRRFVYRFSREDLLDVYGYQVVAFGDRPAALALELGKELASEKAKAIDPQAAHKLMKNSLVDDIGGGGLHEEVERMRGLKTESSQSPGA